MKIKSNFALLDVMQGRRKLETFFKNVERSGPGWSSPLEKIPVTIEGFVSDQWGRDDGISMEFSVDVTKVTLGKPVRNKP